MTAGSVACVIVTPIVVCVTVTPIVACVAVIQTGVCRRVGGETPGEAPQEDRGQRRHGAEENEAQPPRTHPLRVSGGQVCGCTQQTSVSHHVRQIWTRGERERQRQRQKQRQTDRQRHRQRDTDTDRQTDRQTETDRDIDRET